MYVFKVNVSKSKSLKCSLTLNFLLEEKKTSNNYVELNELSKRVPELEIILFLMHFSTRHNRNKRTKTCISTKGLIERGDIRNGLGCSLSLIPFLTLPFLFCDAGDSEKKSFIIKLHPQSLALIS